MKEGSVLELQVFLKTIQLNPLNLLKKNPKAKIFDPKKFIFPML